MKPLIALLLAHLLASPVLAADSVRLSRILTGQSAGALEALVVDGGSWFSARYLVHQAILIEHPKGTFLFDTGVGRVTPQAFEHNGWLDRQLFAYQPINTVADALQAGGYDQSRISGIWPSHLHWDHSGGLPDLAGIPVWVTKEALAHAEVGEAPAFFPEHQAAPGIQWQTLTFNERPYRGFERSLDWFGDDSLVLVDLSGHSPGHTGLFVNLPGGQRFFFIGDTTWTLTGIEENRPRPRITQWMTGVDWDREMNSRQIERIVALKKADPDLVVVPAHDEHAADGIPEFPAWLAPASALPVAGMTPTGVTPSGVTP